MNRHRCRAIRALVTRDAVLSVSAPELTDAMADAMARDPEQVESVRERWKVMSREAAALATLGK